MACTADERAAVWREEALTRIDQAEQLERRATAAESAFAQVRDELASLRSRVGWLADDPRRVEDVLLEFVETAVERTVR